MHRLMMFLQMNKILEQTPAAICWTPEVQELVRHDMFVSHICTVEESSTQITLGMPVHSPHLIK